MQAVGAAVVGKILHPDDPLFGRVIGRGHFARAWDKECFQVKLQPTPPALLYNTMQSCVGGHLLSHVETLNLAMSWGSEGSGGQVGGGWGGCVLHEGVPAGPWH